MAEGVGFEPTGTFRHLQFSRLAQSTTLPPLQNFRHAEVSSADGRKSSKTHRTGRKKWILCLVARHKCAKGGPWTNRPASMAHNPWMD